MPNFIDLSGRQFGRLTALRRVKNPKQPFSKLTFWECSCDCGNHSIVTTSKLLSGHTASCGCYARQATSIANSLYLAGQRFGRWLVIERAPKPDGIKSRNSYWKCICDCGVTRAVLGSSLKNPRHQSCGCLRDEIASARQLKHGEAIGNQSTEYRTWKRIRSRCYAKSHKDYANYGGRGIVMSDDWRLSFEAFLRDMGRKPNPTLTIERLNNDGPYSKDNCVWGTSRQQNSNRRLKNKLSRGVTQSTSLKKPFTATIVIDKRIVYLGCFPTLSEAAQAYRMASWLHFGEVRGVSL